MGSWRSANVKGAAHPLYGGKIKVPCAICNLVHEVRPTTFEKRSANGKVFYCSTQCAAAGHSVAMSGASNPAYAGGKVEVRCAVCGGPKYIMPHRLKTYRYFLCSKKCKIESERRRNAGSGNPSWRGGTKTHPIIGALNRRMSHGIRRSLKDGKAGRPWESFVNYTVHDLKAHLEALFLPGMSWENIGKWHIDHKKPCALFFFTGPSDPQFIECWSLSNLQPLWATDNLHKWAKY